MGHATGHTQPRLSNNNSLWQLFASRAHFGLVFALEFWQCSAIIDEQWWNSNRLIVSNWFTPRQFYFWQKSQNCGAVSLTTLEYLFLSWRGPMRGQGRAGSRGGQLRSFILRPGPRTMIWGDKICCNDPDNYTFYSNFTLPWNLITAQYLNILSGITRGLLYSDLVINRLILSADTHTPLNWLPTRNQTLRDIHHIWICSSLSNWARPKDVTCIVLKTNEKSRL